MKRAVCVIFALVFAALDSAANGPYPESVRTSYYVPMRDGVRLAIDIIRPAASPGVPVEQPLPVIWTYDRYFRAKNEEDMFISKMDQYPWLRTVLSHGYIVAAVDARGAGASFGRWDGPFSRVEAEDAYEITEWLAAQPWATERVGMFGHSYMAAVQFMAAGMQPPHLYAIFPEMPLMDVYEAAYSGGVFRRRFAEQWSDGIANTDRAGIAVPVDQDRAGAMLRAAREAHRANTSAFELLRLLPFRDSAVDGRPHYLDRDLSRYLEGIRKSGVGVYQVAGWRDLWTRDAFLWHENLEGNTRRLVVGPWAHHWRGGLDSAAEHLRWYDHFLKQVDNGVTQEPPVRYYTMGAEAGSEWRTAATWPPEARQTAYYLAAGSALQTEPPASNGVDAYRVDPSTTSGLNSRWNIGSEEPATYREMEANDAKALTYTSAPLEGDIEITGHPVLHVWVSASGGSPDVFAYLEEVLANGFSRYVTEGVLRASHRALATAPFRNFGLPYQRHFRADAAALGDVPQELVFDLLPVSVIFQAGSRIRLSLTGADRGNAETPGLDEPPQIGVHWSGRKLSSLTLPLVERGAAISHAAPKSRDSRRWSAMPALVGAVALALGCAALRARRRRALQSASRWSSH